MDTFNFGEVKDLKRNQLAPITIDDAKKIINSYVLHKYNEQIDKKDFYDWIVHYGYKLTKDLNDSFEGISVASVTYQERNKIISTAAENLEEEFYGARHAQDLLSEENIKYAREQASLILSACDGYPINQKPVWQE